MEPGRKSPLHGNGVFARVSFRRGEKIDYFEGHEVNRSTYHSLLLGGKLVEPTNELKNLNHRCEPNALLADRWLAALRDIAEGEKITIDYTATEILFTSNRRAS